MKRFLSILAATTFLFTIIATSPTNGQTTYYVRQNGTGTGTGSWSNASNDLPGIMSGAADDDTILVGQGTYKAGTEPADTFFLNNAVTVLGGFPPTGNPGLNDRDPAVYFTILSGDLDGDDGPNFANYDDNSEVIVTADFVDQNTVLDGFTLSHANLHALSATQSQLQILHCLFELNGAGVDDQSNPLNPHVGGAMYLSGASPRIQFCILQNNKARTGGAVYSASSSPRFLECLLQQNVARVPAGNTAQLNVRGGALFVSGLAEGAVPTLRRCRMFQNEAIGGDGGALYAGQIDILDCSFEENHASSQFDPGLEADAGGNGGGAFFLGGSTSAPIRVFNVVFRANVSDNPSTVPESLPIAGGGGAYFFRSVAQSVNCLYFDNVTGGAGGALVGASGTFLGVPDNDGLKWHNLTVTENDAAQYDGVLIATADCKIDFRNGIFWNNPPDDESPHEDKNLYVVANEFNVSYSDIQDEMPDDMDVPFDQFDGNIDLDPMFSDPMNDQFRLKPCSPCIDSAETLFVVQDGDDIDGDSTTTCGGCLSGERTPDLDHAARVVAAPQVNDTGVEDNACLVSCGWIIDMGAFEWQDCGGDINGDGEIDGLDIQPFVNCLLAGPEITPGCRCADLDRNDVINNLDVGCMVQSLLTKENACAFMGNCPSGFTTGSDCNGNDIPDANDIYDGTSQDCNQNLIPDECDIDPEDPDGNEEVSADANEDGIPDECQPDCNSNGIPDDKDIADQTSADINSNGVPDECDPDCDADGEPNDYEIAVNGAPDCNQNGTPDGCEPDCNENGVPDDCDIDPTDPDGDEVVYPDCNNSGLPDECDLTMPIFPSFDCNENGIPDECDIADCENDPDCDDCNANGVPDSCDIASSLSEDANENGIPDECEESMMGGGGNAPQGFGGEGMSPEELEAAWEEFFDWVSEQTWGPNSEYTGAQQFQRYLAKLAELGLPFPLFP